MIPIQVLGSGLIPRGYGLAPRKEPFKADKTLILTIMKTPGLRVNFVNPETGGITELNNKNINRIYEKWANYRPTKPAPQTVQNRPVAPVKPANPVVKAQTASFPEKTNQTKVQDVVDQPQGLPMDQLIGSPLRPATVFRSAIVPPPKFETKEETVTFDAKPNTEPTPEPTTPPLNVEANLDVVKGVGTVPPSKIDQPEEITPKNVPDGMSLGLPADPDAIADGEATLITVTNDESKEDSIPEEPVESVGYITPGPAEHTEEDPAPEKTNPLNTFKPILSDDTKRPNNTQHHKNKHNKNRH